MEPESCDHRSCGADFRRESDNVYGFIGVERIYSTIDLDLAAHEHLLIREADHAPAAMAVH